jgi:hypothetical protein
MPLNKTRSVVSTTSPTSLDTLLAIRYKTATEGVANLGSVEIARKIFLNFQKHLYKPHSTYAIAGN